MSLSLGQSVHLRQTGEAGDHNALKRGDCTRVNPLDGCVWICNILPLVHNMRVAVPQALQQWFADDSGATGNAVHNAECLEYLVVYRSRYGYYSEPAKSWYICKAEDEGIAR